MIGAIALALTQVAASPVVYLKCTTIDGGTEKEWTITLNESEGVVDYHTEISGQQRRPARFTADSVYFIGFTLSRVDLSLQRVTTDLVGKVTGSERGTCRVAQPKARAF